MLCASASNTSIFIQSYFKVLQKFAFMVEKSFSFVLISNPRHNILGHVSVAILRRKQDLLHTLRNMCLIHVKTAISYTCVEFISHEISSNTIM